MVAPVPVYCFSITFVYSYNTNMTIFFICHRYIMRSTEPVRLVIDYLVDTLFTGHGLLAMVIHVEGTMREALCVVHNTVVY